MHVRSINSLRADGKHKNTTKEEKERLSNSGTKGTRRSRQVSKYCHKNLFWTEKSSNKIQNSKIMVLFFNKIKNKVLLNPKDLPFVYRHL